MTRTVILLAIAFLTSSCTINQSVTPSGISDNQLICIIEDPEVREGFLDELTVILDEKKIAYEVVNKQQALDLSLIHISEPTRPPVASRMPSSA